MIKNICCILFFSCLYISSFAQFKNIEEGKKFAEPNLEGVKFEKRTTDNKAEDYNYLPKTLQFDRTNIDAPRITQYDKKGKASYIKARLDKQRNFNSPQEELQAFLELAAPLMHCDLRYTSFDQDRVFVDKFGDEHIRMTQTIHGFPILGKEIVLHRKKGEFHLLNGDYIQINKEEEEAVFSLQEQDVKEIVVATDQHHKHLSTAEIEADFAVEFKQWEIEKVYYPKEDKFISAYHIIYYPHLGERMEYVLDANTGEFLENFSALCKFHTHENLPPDGPATANATDLLGQTRLINTYEFNGGFYMLDGSRDMFNSFSSNLPDDPVGAIWTIDANNTAPQNSNFNIGHVTSASNNWGGTPEGVSAQFNAGQAYEYFKEKHVRNGISGAGDNIVSIVNVSGEDGSSMGNAFWNGFAIFYGNGNSAFFPLGRGLDVAGHEMSHGVVQNTANLRYQGESGALNESFADVFGAMIDRNNWTIGEDVVKSGAFPSGALRDLEDPHNGAATNDFARGWQPKHVDEQYLGSQDNGGVHINSGIPNHAYYRIATELGKTKAEQIFYRALTVYLTKSSNFVDFRNAVLTSTLDLYGSDDQVKVVNALIAVGLSAGQGGSGVEDVDDNPGEDFIWYSSEDRDSMFLRNEEGTMIGPKPLIEINHISRPSISDDGSRVVYVGADKRMRGVMVDWAGDSYDPTIVWEGTPMWRNAVISKQGDKIAAVTDDLNNKIVVIDIASGAMKEFELYNPTFTEGIETGEVAFADALEWDYSGQYVMYDAKSVINNTSGESIEFWDIGFLNVWNGPAETFALGSISKLFSSLPENINIGNPTYSKNSPNIIAFDFIEDSENNILGVNSETGEVDLITENTGLGYPNYSKDDRSMVYDVPFIQNGTLAGYDIGRIGISPSKISGNNGSQEMIELYARWPVWFSNGERVLSDVVDLGEGAFNLDIFPVPTQDVLNIRLSDLQGKLNLQLTDIAGKIILRDVILSEMHTLQLGELQAGTYIVKIIGENDHYARKIIKH